MITEAISTEQLESLTDGYTRQIAEIRYNQLSPVAILKKFNQADCVLANYWQGIGKSKSGANFIINKERLNDTDVVIIAGDSHKKNDEYIKEMESVPHIRLYRIQSRNPKECQKFDRIDELFSLNFPRMAEEECRNCKTPCAFKLSKQPIIHIPGTVTVVVTTQSRLQRDKFFYRRFLGLRTMIVIDEPNIFLPQCEKVGRGEINLFVSALSTQPKIPYELEELVQLYKSGRVSRKIHYPNLNIETERYLEGRGLSNHLDVLYGICKGHLVERQGYYTLGKRVPLYYNRILVLAPISADLVRAAYPGIRVSEISMPLMSMKIPPGARFYRITSSIGSFRNFLSNMPRICGFFVLLTIERRRRGKKVLLISKKGFLTLIIKTMNLILSDLGMELRVSTDLSKENTVPIINYGVTGFNDFINYECVFCVNAYNTNPAILSNHLEWVTGYQNTFDFEITMTPTGRKIKSKMDPSTHKLTEQLLAFYEVGVVLQAVGRARPMTTPGTEVISFQASPVLPGEKVFSSLEEARRHFNIQPLDITKRTALQASILEHVRSGHAITDTAKKLNINRSTIHRLLVRQKKEMSNDPANKRPC